MLEAAAAPPPPPPPPSPPPPPPPSWGIISSVPLVLDEDEEDDAVSMSDPFDLSLDILHPPSVSHLTLSRRFCPAKATMKDFPHIISIDPMGLFLLHIPGSPDLTVCLPHRGATGGVDTVPYPSSPIPNLRNTAIISYHGFARTGDYAICELIIHSSDCAIFRSYSTESGKWKVSTELQFDELIPEDWGKGKCGSAISHNKKLWWVDLYFGIITCDPFAEGFVERKRDPFAELQQLHFIPLPGPSVVAESHDNLDKTRSVKVSNKKLRYVLLEPCATNMQAPVVSMWTLDDPDEALWSRQYTVYLSEVNSMPRLEVTPMLALIHPLDPNVLYFFMNGLILAVDVRSRKVIHSQQYSMICPPEQHQCSCFVYAYQLLRKELTAVRDCDEEIGMFAAAPRVLQHDPLSVHRQPLLQQENPSVGIEIVGKIAERHRGNNNFSYGDIGVFPQSCVLHDNPSSLVHGQKLAVAQQGHGNDCTEAVGNNVGNHRGNLIIPGNFSSDTLLCGSDIHLFNSAQDLRKSVDGSTSEWLANEQAWAMLKNPSIFQVTDVDDVTEETYRADGSCMLADHIHFLKKQLKEHIHFLKVSDTKLSQHTMKGNVWERRRLSIQGDDTFSVIQWRIRAKRADGGQAHIRGCEELPAKKLHTTELPPAKLDTPRQAHDAEAAASNAPRRTRDPEAGLSVNERIDRLQAGQQKIMQMLQRIDEIDERTNKLQAGQEKIMQMIERISKQIDQIAPVPTPAPSQPPSASPQDSNRDDLDPCEIHRT